MSEDPGVDTILRWMEWGEDCRGEAQELLHRIDEARALRPVVATEKKPNSPVQPPAIDFRLRFKKE